MGKGMFSYLAENSGNWIGFLNITELIVLPPIIRLQSLLCRRINAGN